MSKIEEEPKITVKFFVDKKKSRVLFAESDNDFVDVLFSFLTLPLGTVVGILGKDSQMGCLDEVYKRVEDLSIDYFSTNACKAMLLSPPNSAYDRCRRLKINVDDNASPRAVYICRDVNCFAHADRAFSSVPDAVCRCGKIMEYIGERPEKDFEVVHAEGVLENGVFVQGNFKFIITDDLRIEPASTSVLLSLFVKSGVRSLEQRTLQLSSEMITMLLKRSLTSKQPLTGLCFDIAIADAETDVYVPSEDFGDIQENERDIVKIRALQGADDSLLLCAEVGEEFVDLLFGLLSVPLGSILNKSDQWLSKGCDHNIYNSISGSAKECMRPEYQRSLLSPKLSPFFSCRTAKMLRVEELPQKKLDIDACFKCFKIGGFSNHGRCHETVLVWDGLSGSYISKLKNCHDNLKTTNLYEWDPRYICKGEAYVKQGPRNLIVTDDLHVVPLSLTSLLQAETMANIHTNDLVEREYTLTKSQVIEVLKSALVTRKAISSVLLSRK